MATLQRTLTGGWRSQMTTVSTSTAEKRSKRSILLLLSGIDARKMRSGQLIVSPDNPVAPGGGCQRSTVGS